MNIKVDVSKLEIETDRLILRPFKNADLDDLYEYAKVEGVGELAGWTHHKNKQESNKILKHFISEKKTLAVVFKGNNKVVGSIGLEDYNTKVLPEYELLRGKELGYVLSKDYWGKGIMTEALDSLIDYCFSKGQMEFLAVEHYIGNNRSKRVIEKQNFKFKKMVRSKKQDGTIVDACLYTLLKCEYDESKKF